MLKYNLEKEFTDKVVSVMLGMNGWKKTYGAGHLNKMQLKRPVCLQSMAKLSKYLPKVGMGETVCIDRG